MVNPSPAFPSAPPAEPPPLYPGLSPQNSLILDKKSNKFAEKTSTTAIVPPQSASSTTVFVVPKGAVILCLDREGLGDSSATSIKKVQKVGNPSPIVHRPSSGNRRRRFARGCALCCCVIFGLISAFSIAVFFLSTFSNHRPEHQIFYGMNGWHPQQ